MSLISTKLVGLVNLIDQSFGRNWTEMTDQTVWTVVDTKRPGWYLIKTEVLVKHNLAIPFSDTGWVVYNGEAEELRTRLSAHYLSGPGTGCLSLASYPCLKKRHWWLTYAYLDDLPEMPNLDAKEGKAIRIFVEQAWRFVHGWPRLCSH